MSNITRRRSGELVRGVFRVLLDHPDGLQAREVLRRLVAQVPPTPFEETIYPTQPNTRRYEKIVRFSTIGAVKAGWLVKEGGIWHLTDEGKDAYARLSDPEEFYREAGRLYRAWAAEQPGDEQETASDETAEAAATLEEAEESAWTEIEEFLGRMSPFDLQDLVAGLLRGMGYHVEWISPPGPDQGIDIIAHVDPLGVKGPRIKAQVKRRADKASAEDVRGFMALMGTSDVGLFVCTGGFTRTAKDEARRQESRRIMLVDLRKLLDLWIEHYARIPEAQRRHLPLRPVYYLAVEQDVGA